MLKVHLHGAGAAAALLTARGRLSLRAKARSWLFWLLWSWPLSWRALVEDVEDDRVDEERFGGGALFREGASPPLAVLGVATFLERSASASAASFRARGAACSRGSSARSVCSIAV
eukprot:scaffold36963_cov63-Phaeocystis_antarctica.AAC.6